ncbi:hypothetical protein SUNI508_11285 [Seiridium unicorne]|uniref:Stress-associated endoplasmic reticulum protein n=1 Tax=Seiridium unicorne TaxID=138068 RepID=A0ABR2UIH8_9PEZI
MAQTPQQRRANAKFVKEQDARRGKSEAVRQARAKETPKSPISPIWLGRDKSRNEDTLADLRTPPVLLGFVVFGGVFFEVLQRIFWR